MDILEAFVDLITQVNNPISNASPVVAAMFAWYCLATGMRHHRFSAGRRLGSTIATTVVTYSATLRTLLEFEFIGQDTFLKLATANAPLLFSSLAYLFWSRAEANLRMERESKLIDRIEAEHTIL